MLSQILAYVSQAHTVVLPENLVDHKTFTLEQVYFLIILRFCFWTVVL